MIDLEGIVRRCQHALGALRGHHPGGCVQAEQVLAHDVTALIGEVRYLRRALAEAVGDGRPKSVPARGPLGNAALAVCAVLILAACCTIPDPAPIKPPAPTVQPAAPNSQPSEVAKLRAALAAAEVADAERIEAERQAAKAAAEAPLRSMLSWSQWAGGALLILGVLALGLSLSPWGSWIPGGTGTAVTAALTGVGVTVAARSMSAVLDLAWLPWAILAAGALAVVAWVGWVAIRATARHADRVEPATTETALAMARAESVADQSRAGVRGLIQFVRGKWRAKV